MAIRTTVDIPEPLHQSLRLKAEQSRTSIRALIVSAIEQTYGPGTKSRYVITPPVKTKRKLGPKLPAAENPHNLVFS